MSEDQATTRRLDAETAGQRWQEVLAAVPEQGARVILEQAGRPVAALIPMHVFDRAVRSERRWQERFSALVDEIQADFADVPPKDVEWEIEQAVAEVRAGARGQRQEERMSAS